MPVKRAMKSRISFSLESCAERVTIRESATVLMAATFAVISSIVDISLVPFNRKFITVLVTVLIHSRDMSDPSILEESAVESFTDCRHHN